MKDLYRIAFLLLSLPFAASAQEKPNVLFLIVDDLRPELGCYGVKEARTPHIDQLAESSLLFRRAYCQQAICMSSRFSLLSGFRPDEENIYTNRDVRPKLQDIDFLPGYFRKHGYHTVGIGKIAHNGWEDPRCWSEPHQMPPNAPWEYRTRAGRKLVEKIQAEAKAAGKPDPFQNIPERIRRGMAWENLDVKDSDLGDGQIADLTIAALEKAVDTEKPFFIAAGFLRPHLPFVAPRHYYDLFDPASLPTPPNPIPPAGAPKPARSGSGELLNQYRALPKKLPLAPGTAKQLVHAYYACVSYIDAQVGRILQVVEANGLAENTIVVFTSDHGFQLGDHGAWGKATNFELSTRVPLLLRVPEKASAGKATDSIVELVDLYPTLCELAGLPKPAHLQGESFTEAITDPSTNTETTAMSQFSRGGLKGYSIRTDRFRYTEWQKPESGEVKFRELYDHRRNSLEDRNVVDESGFAKEVEKLGRLLKAKMSE